MRIITGSLKGRTIPFNPRQCGQIHLTSSLLKEALFSMMGGDLEGLEFLDLCAGCGQIGLEAYSRGARVAMNEPDRRRFAQLKRVQEEWGLAGLELHHMKAQLLIPQQELRGRRFDVIYLDPPYEAQLGGLPLSLALLELLGQSGLLSPEGWCLVQHPDELDLPEETGCLALRRRRDYGRTRLSIYSPLNTHSREVA